MTNRSIPVLPLAAVALVLLFVAWVYWPGQTGPALLDDQTSVLVIGDLRESPGLFWDYVSGDRSGPLGRPVSVTSFVLEKLFLDGSLATSKRVNILLHLFNGGLVICLFWLLFQYIGVPGYPWLAIVLGAGWLLLPLNVSTVLYVVQRMAMLCTTFMLLACITYTLWRQRLARGRLSIVLLVVLALNISLGVFSKENGIVVIPILLLIEALWFQFRGEKGQKIIWFRRTTLGLIALGLLGVLIFLMVNYEMLAAAFERRPYTLDERLLTQSRVLWDYLGQLYVPDVARMGLYHDDVLVSTSLDSPKSTTYAMAGWLGVLLFSLALLRWRTGSLLVLGLAWYLVGHSIEASVFALELYFEHRNYFPGIGLLLLIGAVYILLVGRWPEIKSPLLVSLTCYVLWLAMFTGSQVQIWSSHPLLILSHLNGHPDSFRANSDMAVQMASLGEFEVAQKYSAKANAASTGEYSGDHDIRNLALACIANGQVEPEQIARLGMRNPERPFGSADTLQTLVRFLQDNACPNFDRLGFANRMMEIYLGEDSRATASANIYLGLALLENTLQRWQNANAYIDIYLDMAPGTVQGLLMKLHFTSALGKVSEADEITVLLQQKKERGELTVGEQQTLSLYLEQ